MNVNVFPLLLVFILFSFWGAVLAPEVQARAYIEDNNKAVELLENGHFLEGIELLKESLASVPYNEEIHENLRRSYLVAGQAFIHQNRYEDLAVLMLEAQEFNDTQREFWSMRGFALLRMKQYDEAEVELQEARAMGEPDVHILFQLGELYYDTDRMYEALDILERALFYDSDNHAVVHMLGKVRRELAVEMEMEKEYGGHFVITFDGQQNDDLGSEVLEVLEDAYNQLGSQLDHYPAERVTVLLYSRQQFSELTDSPDWSGGLYDGKIRLPVGGISSINRNVRALLYHEYMHVMLRDIAGQNLPYWLNEGLAEMAEARIVPRNLDMLLLARDQQKLFSLVSLEKSFRNLSGMQVILAYQQSYSFVRFLIDDYGWHRVRDLLFALSAGASIADAIDKVFGAYDVNYQRLEEIWREAG